MPYSVVLVGVEYPVNLGMIARLMANFNVEELILVSPVCNKEDETARMYAKKATYILESARTVNSLNDIEEEFDLLVATTGVIDRFRNIFKSHYTLKEFSKRIPKNSKVALVFGREGIGLTENEIDFCDFIITIPTSERYRVLNLANAVGIVLYELSNTKPKRPKTIDPSQKKILYETVDALIEILSSKKFLRNPKKVKSAFRRIFSMSILPEKETKAIIGVLINLKKLLEEKKT